MKPGKVDANMELLAIMLQCHWACGGWLITCIFNLNSYHI